MMEHEEKKGAYIDFANSQTGEVAFGNVAGHDHITTTTTTTTGPSEDQTNNYGLTSKDVVRILDSFADEAHYRRDLESKAREIRQEQTDQMFSEITQATRHIAEQFARHNLERTREDSKKQTQSLHIDAMRGRMDVLTNELFWLRVTLIIAGGLFFLLLIFILLLDRVAAGGAQAVWLLLAQTW